MYWMCGWPAIYNIPSGEKIRCIQQNSDKTLTAIVTAHFVYIWSFVQNEGVLLGCWCHGTENIGSQDSSNIEAQTVHENVLVLWKADSTMMALITTTSTIFLLSVVSDRTNNDSSNQRPLFSFSGASWHDEVSLGAPIFTPVCLCLKKCLPLWGGEIDVHSIKYCITCASVSEDQIVLGLRNGAVYFLDWTGVAKFGVQFLPKYVRENKSSVLENIYNTTEDKHTDVNYYINMKKKNCFKDNNINCFDNNSLTNTFSNALIDIVFCPIIHLLVVVVIHGTLAICPIYMSEILKPNKFQKKILHFCREKSCKVAINPKHHLIAVGLENGDVFLYRVESEDSNIHIKYQRTLSISSCGFTASDTGKVSGMQWSPDWEVLVVGWHLRGMIVWSINGCRLASTLPQVGGSQVPEVIFNLPIEKRVKKKKTRELIANGVLTLSWCGGGFTLLVASRLPSSQASHSQPFSASSVFHKFSFLHTCMANNPGQSENTSLVLLGDDRVVIWNPEHNCSSDVDAENEEEDDDDDENGVMCTERSACIFSPGVFDPSSRFTSIQVPSQYLRFNWPLQHCAISYSGYQLAVSGKQGVIIYNMKTKRWRIFGNLNHERQIDCIHLSWYGEHILCLANIGQMHPPNTIGYMNQASSLRDSIQSCDNDITNKKNSSVPKQCELLFYPRSHLDNSSLLHTHSLQYNFEIFAITIEEDMLLMQLSSGQLLIYHLSANIIDSSQSTGSSSTISTRSYDPLLNHGNLSSSRKKKIILSLELCYVIESPFTHPLYQMRLWLHPSPLHPPKVQSKAISSKSKSSLSSFPPSSLPLTKKSTTNNFRNCAGLKPTKIANENIETSLKVSTPTSISSFPTTFITIPSPLTPKQRKKAGELSTSVFTFKRSKSSPTSLVQHQSTFNAFRPSKFVSLRCQTESRSASMPLHRASSETRSTSPTWRQKIRTSQTTLAVTLPTSPFHRRLRSGNGKNKKIPFPKIIGQRCIHPINIPRKVMNIPEAQSPIVSSSDQHPIDIIKEKDDLHIDETAQRSLRGEYCLPKYRKRFSCIVISKKKELYIIEVFPFSGHTRRESYKRPRKYNLPKIRVIKHVERPSTRCNRGWIRRSVRCRYSIVDKHVQQFWLHRPSPKRFFGLYQQLYCSIFDLSHPCYSFNSQNKINCPPINSFLNNHRIHKHQMRTETSWKSSAALKKKKKENDLHFIQESYMFTHGQHGINIWFRYHSHTNERYTEQQMPPFHFISKKLIPFDQNIFPLGIDSHLGVLVGLFNKVKLHANQSIKKSVNNTIDDVHACFFYESKLHPYLHVILKHLVTHGNNGFLEAYQLVSKCHWQMFTPVSLELLLYTSLMDEKVQHQYEYSSLKRVVSFLRSCPEFEDIVINCARKIESSHWPQLFDIIGSPRKLYEKCLLRAKIRTASQYLLIIQCLEGVELARNLAYQLLSQLKESRTGEITSKTYCLIKDIRRFLDKTSTIKDHEIKNKISISIRKSKNNNNNNNHISIKTIPTSTSTTICMISTITSDDNNNINNTNNFDIPSNDNNNILVIEAQKNKRKMREDEEYIANDEEYVNDASISDRYIDFDAVDRNDHTNSNKNTVEDKCEDSNCSNDPWDNSCILL